MGRLTFEQQTRNMLFDRPVVRAGHWRARKPRYRPARQPIAEDAYAGRDDTVRQYGDTAFDKRAGRT